MQSAPERIAAAATTDNRNGWTPRAAARLLFQHAIFTQLVVVLPGILRFPVQIDNVSAIIDAAVLRQSNHHVLAGRGRFAEQDRLAALQVVGFSRRLDGDEDGLARDRAVFDCDYGL